MEATCSPFQLALFHSRRHRLCGTQQLTGTLKRLSGGMTLREGAVTLKGEGGWGPEGVGARRGGGPEGWGPGGVGARRGGGPEGWGPNPEKVGAQRFWGRRGGGPKLWGPEGVGARRVGGPKFRAFFSLSHRKIHSFFSLWEVFSLNLVVFLKTGTLKCARLGSLVVVWNPGGRGDARALFERLAASPGRDTNTGQG